MNQDVPAKFVSNRVDIFFVLHVVFLTACVAGLLYQTHYILSIYMQYKVGSNVEVRATDLLDPPDMTVCIRYADILTEGGFTESDREKLDKRPRIREIQSNVTVKQIFEHSPSVESIVSGCVHKIPDSYEIHIHMNKSLCLSLINGTRFYTQEYICYRFHLNVNRTRVMTGKFKYDNIALSLSYPGLFFAMLLDNSTKVLGHANVVKIVAHDRRSLPFDDLAYAQYFSRQVDNVVVYSEISVFYQKTHLKLLPPPYATACNAYKAFMGSRKNCINECLKKLTVAQFNKFPFSVIEWKPVDHKLISGHDIRGRKFDKVLDRLENGCEKWCQADQCKRNMFATQVLKEGKGEFPYFVVRLYVPMVPKMIVTSVPISTLQDLLVYISTSMSVWLGISIMAINPLELLKKLLWKKKVDRGEECHCEHCSETIKTLSREMDQMIRHQKRLLIGYEYDSGAIPRV